MAERGSKSIPNWQRYPSSKCYESDEILWFGIWQSAVAPSDSAEKNGNTCAQLQSIRCTKAPNIVWKIYFLYDFRGTQPCSFHSKTTCMKFDNCCQRYIASCWKNFFI